jgi:hypothetical protein
VTDQTNNNQACRVVHLLLALVQQPVCLATERFGIHNQHILQAARQHKALVLPLEWLVTVQLRPLQLIQADVVRLMAGVLRLVKRVMDPVASNQRYLVVHLLKDLVLRQDMLAMAHLLRAQTINPDVLLSLVGVPQRECLAVFN